MKTNPDHLSPGYDRQIENIVEDLSRQDVMPIGDEIAEESIDLDPVDAGDPAAFRQAERWDEPVGGEGHRAARVPLEDENKAADVLVHRGVTEAADELSELEEDEAAAEEAAEEP